MLTARKVISGGYGFPGPFRHVHVESADGYGFPRRTCGSANKKETTWCAALADLRSRIKYSPISFT